MRLPSGLLALLLAVPSFGAPVEVVRIESQNISSAPGASAAATLSPSPAAAIAPAALSAPAFVSAAAAPSPAAVAAFAGETIAAAPSPAHADHPAAAPEARGPPELALVRRTPESLAAHVAATVKSWGAPVEQIFEKHDVLLVGENHGSLDSVNTLTREMPRLAAAGVKAVGIEGLKRPHHEQVDAYVSRKTDVLPDDALLFSPRRQAAFRGLLKAAREQGIRVVALGLPLEQWSAQTAELAARNTGRPAQEFSGDAGAQFERAQTRYEEGFNEAVAEVYLTRRNKAMASILLDAMKTGGKAVVLIGQAHVEGLDMVPGRLLNAPGAWGTLASELTGLAVRTFSLTQTGGLFIDADAASLDKLARPESYRAAAEVSPNGRPSYQELGPDRGLWHAGGRSAPVLAR
jgi:Haem-binding uptake, Tiki superfamily, ChaN